MSGITLARPLQLVDKPVTRVENYCATGAESLRQAAYAVASGAYDTAMAIGVEKTKDGGFQGLNAVAPPNDGTGRTLTAAAMFSMVPPAYAAKYGVDAGKMRDAQAGITDPRRELALAEVHDCFTITELVLMEDLGFSERGAAWRDELDGIYDLDGELPVNPDGGLKSFGHPVGASGLRMMFEAWLQLRGEAPPERQIQSAKPGGGARL